MFSRSIVRRIVHGGIPVLMKPFGMIHSSFHTHSIKQQQNGSLFGELTKSNEVKEPETSINTAQSSKEELDPADITPENDETLHEYYMEQSLQEQISREKYISPLKRKLFDINVVNNGFYKNDQIVIDEETNKTYKLSLTKEEIEILEPSIFLQSYRIKSSMKKATLVNRFVRGWDVKTAINQLHFNPKKMSTELEQLLKKGLEQAQSLKLNDNELYIASLWTGSDGQWRKRVDAKGRGRTGIIEHPYIHLKAILKTNQTKLRLNWEKQQIKANEKPVMGLINEPLNFSVRPYYKW